jgi:hypothetical protein
MKRQLFPEELELEQKGLDRNLEQLRELTNNLEYNKELVQKQVDQRKHEDKWREYLRSQKDKEDKKVLDIIESEIKLLQEKIDIAESNIKDGVEVKETLGVQ